MSNSVLDRMPDCMPECLPNDRPDSESNRLKWRLPYRHHVPGKNVLRCQKDCQRHCQIQCQRNVRCTMTIWKTAKTEWPKECQNICKQSVRVLAIEGLTFSVSVTSSDILSHTCLAFCRFTWHISSFYLTFYLAFYLEIHLLFYLICNLTLYLAFYLTFHLHLAFWRAHSGITPHVHILAF